MKIQLASDLHLELRRHAPVDRLIVPAPDADLLVLAGDIHGGIRAIEVFNDWPVPVVYVAGNHEFYGHQWQRIRADLRSASTGTNVRYLDNDALDFEGIRILGTTLWTDFCQPDMVQSQSMREVQRGLNDYYRIGTQDGVLRARDTLADHLLSRAWLERELAADWPGKTVVVSHHGPHPLSIHPRYLGSRINGGFVSDLTELLKSADLWLHGHVHDSFDYSVEGCRVVANPAGYEHAFYGLENRQFNPSLVIDV